ncbi:MAG TPA: family 10 glycosylhydrolase, partial [Nannocystaceae bacterium]|nr:family 10 glycosylhydrolase [Nannocystaceae bacterium]
DVDGVHFDDYFYPYPDGSPFPDDATRQEYVDGGGTLSLGDWRRQNVHDMVEAVHLGIEAARPDVRFGISPFGIYRPGMPEGITGLDQYESIYSDPLVWIDEGWVDYLAPQLYWPSTQTQQAYAPLLAWWAEQTSGGRYIFPGNFLSKLGSDASWDVEEFLVQIELTRAQREMGAMGNIFFHIAPLAADQDGVATAFVDEFYDTPVLTPAIAAHLDDVVEPPWVELAGDTATLVPGDDQRLRAWVVYEDLGAGWELGELVPATTTEVSLGTGRWAVSAVARTGAESLGTVVEVP